MAGIFALIWIIGGTGLGVLSIPARSEDPRWSRVARLAGGVWLSLVALGVAAVFVVGNANPIHNYRPSRSGWWVVVVLGGAPFALAYVAALRRAYAGRLPVLFLVALASAATYLAFPYGFVPASRPLHGLGLWEHRHHAVDVLVLCLPAILTVIGEWIPLRAGGPQRYGPPGRSS